MGFGPRDVLPAIPAAPPRISLISTALTDTPASDRWISGFSWLPENCSGSGILDICAITAKTIPAQQGSLTYDPYTIWAGDKCSPFQFLTRDWKGRALRLLAACESWQIAHELWEGTLPAAVAYDPAQPYGSNKYLADPTSDTVTSGSSTPKAALAALEWGLGQCGCGRRGVIHATRDTITYWSSDFLLDLTGDLVTTKNGTLVIPDGGYTGSGPGNTPRTNGHCWAYATGMPVVRRSAPEVFPDTFAEATNRDTNLVEFRAERAAAATWDCCHFAAELDIPLPLINGAS